MTTTLGTSRDAQIIEEYEGESLQKFLLHYNFPPFSVGEVRFLRGPGRREIGHGVLARRALTPLIPHEDDFRYTVRLVSDILESNGSSSMATVCGGSLALFDAGVPMLDHVAGVAMGLIKEVDGDRFAVLSDIAGQEDHYGDMDFKVAGTHDGITALQMDIKIAGVNQTIMETALEQARVGRLHILGLMEKALEKPRADLSDFAPRLTTMEIPKDKIRDIIGPGGKTIRAIQEETGCRLEIEDNGTIIIASPDGVAAARAIEIIGRITEVAEVGKIYTGPVRRVEGYGAFVEILPGTDGLVHISELAPYRVRETTDIVKEGDEVTVKVIDIDDSGKVRLSRKAVIMEAPDYNPADYEGMGDEGGGGGGGGDDDRGGRGPDRGGRGPDRGGRGGRPSDRGGRGPSGGGRGPSGGGRGPSGGGRGPDRSSDRGSRGPSDRSAGGDRSPRAADRGARGPSSDRSPAPDRGGRSPERGERSGGRAPARGPERGDRFDRSTSNRTPEQDDNRGNRIDPGNRADSGDRFDRGGRGAGGPSGPRGRR